MKKTNQIPTYIPEGEIDLPNIKMDFCLKMKGYLSFTELQIDVKGITPKDFLAVERGMRVLVQ